MLGIDSLPQEGVPKGKVVQHSWKTSSVYPDTTRDYWVYVPAQYDDAEPACVMVFQDGGAYVNPEGPVRAPTVFDNLIHSGEMPITIGVFVASGMKDGESNRDAEYVARGDVYARFLVDEILPEVSRDYNLVEDAAGRAICGMSDGGLCAFAVAWEKPYLFSKVISHIGSFIRNLAGVDFPHLIRRTRGNPKPLRVFLQDGENDLNINEGNWTIGNLNLASALMFARYDYRFELGAGGHDLSHGGEMFPETLRWLWRDYPGVKRAGDAPDFDRVIGQWQVTANAFGMVSNSVLTVDLRDGALVATLHDEDENEIEVTAIRFENGILSYDYLPPPSQVNWGKEPNRLMTTWLKVKGNVLEGALSGESSAETTYDFSVKGTKCVVEENYRSSDDQH